MLTTGSDASAPPAFVDGLCVKAWLWLNVLNKTEMTVFEATALWAVPLTLLETLEYFWTAPSN